MPRPASLMGLVIATPILAGMSGGTTQAADRIIVEILNHATEAILTVVETARCVDNAAALDGRTVLIERPRLGATLTVDRSGACATAGTVLDVALYHLAGGEIGRVEVAVAENGALAPSATAGRGYNACVEVTRAPTESGLRLTFDFAPCE